MRAMPTIGGFNGLHFSFQAGWHRKHVIALFSCTTQSLVEGVEVLTQAALITGVISIISKHGALAHVIGGNHVWQVWRHRFGYVGNIWNSQRTNVLFILCEHRVYQINQTLKTNSCSLKLDPVTKVYSWLCGWGYRQVLHRSFHLIQIYFTDARGATRSCWRHLRTENLCFRLGNELNKSLYH